MTDPRRVEELYHAALELPEDEREALLSEACGSDTALLAEVRSLLGDAEQARHLLDRPVAEAATERLAVAPGTRLSHYEIGERIGAGGMGEVYRARDPRLERDVAVKVLRGDVAADPERQRRFQREARAAGALSHPNVLAVYDVGAENGIAFVVSELLEGQTLRERLRDGSLTPRKSVEIAAQVAAGLAAAHAKGIVHRDLKPENVFLTHEGVAKILDFGLARLTQVNPPAGPAPSAATSSATASGALLGTAAYMSPEQARGSRADHRSDIFSLGIVLYEMLARAHPFRGETAAETLAKILREDPAPLAERAVPGPLAHVVHRCLEKRPEDRFESAHDLGLALGAALEPGAVPARRAPPARPARVGRLAAAATLAGAAAALALVALLRTPPRPAVGEIRQITHDGRLKAVRPRGGFHTSLVSDGSRVYFSELSAAPRSALVAGGGVESVSGALPSREPFTLVGDISPDGGELLLEAALASGSERPLWIWPLAGGAPRRLGGLVGHSPAFAPGGERIAYASGEEIRLTSRDGAPSTRLASVEGRPFALRWSPDGGRLRSSAAGAGRPTAATTSSRGTTVAASTCGRSATPPAAPRPTPSVSPPAPSATGFRPRARTAGSSSRSASTSAAS